MTLWILSVLVILLLSCCVLLVLLARRVRALESWRRSVTSVVDLVRGCDRYE